MSDPLITKAEFSRRLEVSKARVSQMIGMGCPVSPDGLIPLAEALEWVRQNVNRVVRAKASGVKPDAAGDLPPLVEARTRLLMVQVDRNRVALTRERGDLVDREETRRALSAFSRLIRDKWVNFGNRYGQQIAAAIGAEPKALMAELDKAVRLQLDEIANVRAPGLEGKSNA